MVTFIIHSSRSDEKFFQKNSHYRKIHDDTNDTQTVAKKGQNSYSSFRANDFNGPQSASKCKYRMRSTLCRHRLDFNFLQKHEHYSAYNSIITSHHYPTMMIKNIQIFLNSRTQKTSQLL